MTTLPEAESGHCVRVLRMKTGDEIMCVDGLGHRYRCLITEANSKHCGIKLIEKEDVPTHWEVNITLCFAPTKHIDRMEWMTEKCTEMGIDRLIPVECCHSERRVLKTERLQKILVSAMKQSLKATLPKLDELTSVEKIITGLTYLDGQQWNGRKFICYCSDNIERHELSQEYKPGEDIAILIGPEGDFSPREVELAIQHGWMPVSLGQSRLRAETAAITAVAYAHCINSQKCISTLTETND